MTGTGASSGSYIFSDQARTRGVAWVAVVLAVSVLAATRVTSPESFLVTLPLTSGLLTWPAIIAAFIAARTVQGPLRPFWRWFVLGNLTFVLVGVGITGYGTDQQPHNIWLTLGALAVALTFDVLAIDAIVAARSGGRSRSVDLVESAAAVIMVTAPVTVLVGDELASSPYAWFGVVTLGCLVLFIAALWASVVLFVRSPAGTRHAAAAGIALGIASVLDALVQVLHVVSGFELPVVPLIAFHTLTTSMLLLVPLWARQGHARGLERLPPQAQIRTGRVVAAVTVAALPVLAVSFVAAGATPTAARVAGAALSALVVLSAVRQLLTYSETRCLYGAVERSADERRALLAAVLESMDAERRRVAMQLHEQASSSYAALASLVPVDDHAVPGDSWHRAPPLSTASPGRTGTRLRPVQARPLSHLLTERMAAQAESLRELIGAIRPSSEQAQASIAPIIHAYVEGLDDGARPGVTTVDVAPDLRLDWITETVALRVVQEAVRNTCEHANAEHLHIVLDVEDGIAVVRVSDDGAGFDMDGLVVESGIATMRRFVSFCEGELTLRSSPGRGTLVEARLGGAVRVVPRPPRLRPV